MPTISKNKCEALVITSYKFIFALAFALPFAIPLWIEKIKAGFFVN